MKYLTFILMVFSLVACDQINELSQPTAEEMLSEYLTALNKKDYAAAYDKLSSADKSYKSLTEFSRPSAEKSPMADLMLGKTTYKIQSIVVTDDNAIATVDQTIPDLTAMAGDLLSVAMAAAFSKDDTNSEALMTKAIKEKYSDGTMPTTTTTEKINLIKEQTGWRIHAKLRETDEIATRKGKIQAMLKSAKQLRDSKQYVKAIEIYSDVITEDNTNTDATAALEETENELSEQKVKQDYIKKVKIFDFEATRIDTYSKKNIPAITFAVKNEGNRTLNKVEVTVYFKDLDGNTVFEENYHPVLVSKYNFRDNKPLKPNYVKRQEKGNYYTISELGDEWKTGAAEAVVTDIEFE